MTNEQGLIEIRNCLATIRYYTQEFRYLVWPRDVSIMNNNIRIIKQAHNRLNQLNQKYFFTHRIK